MVAHREKRHSTADESRVNRVDLLELDDDLR